MERKQKKTERGMSPMDYAMRYLTTRDRTAAEMQAYLDRQSFGEADVDATIERLTELGLLNDRRYAEQFVATRLSTKPLSRAHLRRQLIEHHVDASLIDEALSAVSQDDELENAIAVAKKFRRTFEKLDGETRERRILSRLEARGFGYDVCMKALRAAEESEQNEEDCR